MKSIVIFLFSILIIQSVSAQIYVSKAIKFASRTDAYPYGQPVESNLDVEMDFENHKLKLSNIPNYSFDFKLISESPRNNGKIVRLSSFCPEHKRCFIIAYVENDQIMNLEIKFVTTSYMYYLATT